ncbi:MAG: FTR1 family iron permease [Pegethrix bostrychoides GSE-TBD4-15B]|jgi:high-affinity iron transporter|uniref:FTR1 family iron permease n=1 Tax=Pegethrix bostrychoides GSE-TBD4-15B TaxID=2839662 RepID=A0A951PBI8_9CYAN|nr:FTR1 family iron permease [Pegethrix bostrychoides GSE-TBD4-15B]
MDFSSALPTFVVTLREGTEASLVVGIVLAYLKKAGQSRFNAWVFAGIAAGLAGSLLVGLLFNGLLVALDSSDQAYAPIWKQLLEGGFGLVAIGLLSWMLVWMTQQARQLKSEVESSIASTLQQGDAAAGWGLFGLVTVAVLREGFETVVFLAAQFQQGWIPALGAVAGLVGATLIGFLLFQLGVKINLRQFFQVMGLLLLLIVSGLVVSALRHFDQAARLYSDLGETSLCFSADSCILGSQVWDLTKVLPDRQFPGILLKAFFGYTQKLYLAQAVGYVGFLLSVGWLYLRSLGLLPASGVKQQA